MPTVLTFDSLITDLQVYIERGFTAGSDPEVYAQLPRLINDAERNIAIELKVQGFLEFGVSFFAVGNDVYDKPDRWREWVSINYGTVDSIFSTTSRQSAAGIRTLTLNKPHGLGVGDQVNVSSVGETTYNTGTGLVTLLAVTQLTVSYAQGVLTDGPTADTGGLVVESMQKRRYLKPRSLEYCRSYWPDPRQLGDPLYYADYDYYHYLVTPTPRLAAPFEIGYYQLPPLLDATNQTNWLTDIAPTLLRYKTLLEAAPFLKNDDRIQVWEQRYGQAAQALTGQDLDKIQDRTSERDKP